MVEVKRNSIKAWILAARPKTLAGALMPVFIGTALAASEGKLNLIPALICALFAILMQIAANFINDLFDYLKGTDREDRLGPERACAQGWISPSAMKKGIIMTIIAACLTGLTLLLYGGLWLIGVGILCVLFAFLYTTGPYPLSYHGWGDLLVLLFFGFVPVCGTYYVQTLHITPLLIPASLISGVAVDTLLVVNNYRDRDADRISGKRTVVVRFGERFGKYLYLLLGMMAAWISFSFIPAGHLYAAILPQFYLIPHIRTWQKMVQIKEGKALNTILGETSRNMLILGILLCIGLLL